MTAFQWPAALRPDSLRVTLEQVESWYSFGPSVLLSGDFRVGTHSIHVDTNEIDLADVRGLDLTVLEIAAAILLLVALGALFVLIETGHSRSWWATSTTVGRHIAQDRLPRDPVAFLDDAHRLGLLRAVGPTYQFRHAELQAYLAAKN
ncbi:MAG: hypothetical protein ABW022_09785 [Actinoplanes sp.]